MRTITYFAFAVPIWVIMGGWAGAATPANPGPTPPLNSANIEKTASEAKEIRVHCPADIQIGPSFVPSGWVSLGSLPMQILEISWDVQNRSVVCFYNNSKA